MDLGQVQALRARFGERLRCDEPLSRHTSFRIGGPADFFVEVESTDDVAALSAFAHSTDTPLWVLGGGTNVLVSDRGVRGIVLHPGRGLAFSEWTPNGVGTKVTAGAALTFKKLVTEAIARNLTGLEFAEGIPGSVGGGLLMNAGAFGGEISDVVEWVEGVANDGTVHRAPRSVLNFSYRHFDLPRGWMVTRVGFRLLPGDPTAVRAKRDDAKRRRESKQPVGYPNAGSVFKNPPGTFAGKLIEAAGLKGFRVGNAQVAEQHANFILNLGGATASDVRGLMREIQRRVRAHAGVALEAEIKLIGDWEAE